MEEVDASRVSAMFSADPQFEIVTQSTGKFNCFMKQNSDTSLI
jgi:hypothetical protein